MEKISSCSDEMRIGDGNELENWASNGFPSFSPTEFLAFIFAVVNAISAKIHSHP